MSGLRIRSRSAGVSNAALAGWLKLKPGKNAARSVVSSTSALQYSIASWATATWWADRKPWMFSTVGNCCFTVWKVFFTAEFCELTPVICAIVALISSNTRTPTSGCGAPSGGGGGVSGAGCVCTLVCVPSTSKRQEELVAVRPLVQRDHRADVVQHLARGADGRVEIDVGLADRGLDAVHADAHALDGDVQHRRSVAQHDEHRLLEQVAVAVELADLEHDVGVRHVHEARHREQQEELLADADGHVLLDLRLGERAVVDRDQAQHALPLAVAGDLVAEHQRERVVPVVEVAAAAPDPRPR